MSRLRSRVWLALLAFVCATASSCKFKAEGRGEDFGSRYRCGNHSNSHVGRASELSDLEAKYGCSGFTKV